MNQKTAVILSTIVTTFSLVLLGGVAGRFTTAADPVTPDTVVQTEQMPGENASYAPPAQEQPAQEQPAQAAPTVAITPDKAASVALSDVPGATLQKTPELVDFEGTVAYEVLLDNACLLYTSDAADD